MYPDRTIRSRTLLSELPENSGMPRPSFPTEDPKLLTTVSATPKLATRDMPVIILAITSSIKTNKVPSCEGSTKLTSNVKEVGREIPGGKVECV
jgi:hypothetical protein